MTMLTPALSELQEPSKFSELRMESVQSYFKNLKYPQNVSRYASVPLLRHSAASAQNVRATVATGVPHLVSICWRLLSERV